MAGDQSISDVRSPQRTSATVRIQGIVVAALAALPLTVSGHYVANVLTGATTRGIRVATVAWLLVFSFVGVVLVLTAMSNLLPGWRRAGRVPVWALGGGVVIATIDYWRLADSPTGLALNLAGLGVAVAALQAIYWTPRTPFTTISLRTSERVQEWAAGVLVLGGLLAFALPHPSTIDGAAEDCAPLWLAVERDCLAPDLTWWPVPIASIIVGTTLLGIIHHDGTRTLRPMAPPRVITKGRAVRSAYGLSDTLTGDPVTDHSMTRGTDPDD